MTNFGGLLLSILALYYSGLLLLYRRGLRRAGGNTHRSREPQRRPFVSVIVPARNEEESIGACLEALLATSYPSDRYEVIVVDDRATDRTAARVRRVQQRQNAAVAGVAEARQPGPACVRLVRTGPTSGHKAAALQTGRAHARGEIIATTDADCRVAQGWLEAMTGRLGPDVGFVAGPVHYAPARTLLERLQALESLGLVAVGAGAAGIGRPHVCNSANIMYRRSVYDTLGQSGTAPDDRPVSAGDDELLLQHIAREPHVPYRAAFCADPAATVTAQPERTLRAFLRQRHRWAATGARYRYAGVRATLAGIYLFYMALAVGLVTLVWVPALWPFVAGSLAMKILAEAGLLMAARRILRARVDLWLLAPAQLLQIPYVVLMGLAAPLGPVSWKGRKIH